MTDYRLHHASLRLQDLAEMARKPVPLWPALVAGAFLLFLIYAAVLEHRRREAKKQEILDRYFPALATPGEK